MLLGIISDTHDNLGLAVKAIAIMHARNVDTIIHCGDFTRPTVAASLTGARAIGVRGNGDYDADALRTIFTGMRADNYFDTDFDGMVGGFRVGVTHGHRPATITTWLAGGRHDLIIHGHSHRRRDEQQGRTRIINPGALGGTRHESRSICILDLSTGTADFVTLARW